jgi:hypothetical protein
VVEREEERWEKGRWKSRKKVGNAKSALTILTGTAWGVTKLLLAAQQASDAYVTVARDKGSRARGRGGRSLTKRGGWRCSRCPSRLKQNQAARRDVAQVDIANLRLARLHRKRVHTLRVTMNCVW